MNHSGNRMLVNLLKGLIALLPWLASMYLLFWLAQLQFWDRANVWRDAATIGILLIGFLVSFALVSQLFGLRKSRINRA